MRGCLGVWRWNEDWITKGTRKFLELFEVMVPQTNATTHQNVHLNMCSSYYINYTSINLLDFREKKTDLKVLPLFKQNKSSELETFAGNHDLDLLSKAWLKCWNEWYWRTAQGNTKHPIAHVLMSKSKTFGPISPVPHQNVLGHSFSQCSQLFFNQDLK